MSSEKQTFSVVQDGVNERYPTLKEQQKLAEEIGLDLKGETNLEKTSEEIAFFMIQNDIRFKEEDGDEQDSEESGSPAPPPAEASKGNEAQEETALPSSPPEIGETQPQVAEGDDFQSPIAHDTTAKHWVRQIIPSSPGAEALAENNPNLMTGETAEAYIKEQYLDNGYEMIAFNYMGQSLADYGGHNVMGIFAKPQGRESQQSEVRIKLQAVALGMAAFQADGWLSWHLDEGFTLLESQVIAFDENGIFTLWVLVK